MPYYDRKCGSCEKLYIDCWEPITAPAHACECGQPTQRVLLPNGRKAIPDECDVWVKHGICNEDGTPRHYRSKSEMRRVARERGLEPYVQHIGTKGGDRSVHTSRWI